MLIDIVMPGVDGIAATRRILHERPDQVIILISGIASDELAMLGIRVGAAGFLSKDISLDALPRAIDGAMRGEAAMSQDVGPTRHRAVAGAAGRGRSPADPQFAHPARVGGARTRVPGADASRRSPAPSSSRPRRCGPTSSASGASSASARIRRRSRRPDGCSDSRSDGDRLPSAHPSRRVRVVAVTQSDPFFTGRFFESFLAGSAVDLVEIVLLRNFNESRVALLRRLAGFYSMP